MSLTFCVLFLTFLYVTAKQEVPYISYMHFTEFRDTFYTFRPEILVTLYFSFITKLTICSDSFLNAASIFHNQMNKEKNISSSFRAVAALARCGQPTQTECDVLLFPWGSCVV